MKVSLREWRPSMTQFRRSWFFRIVFFIVAALLAIRGVEDFLIARFESNWDQTVDDKCAQILAKAQNEFEGVQRTTRRVATEIGQQGDVVDFLTGRNPDRIALFACVSRISRDQGFGIEVYDTSGTLVAWEGRSGPSHRVEVLRALHGQLSSFVTRMPVFSQLYVATPVRQNGNILGAVIVRRNIEVNYPLNNAYIRREGLTQSLTRTLGVSIEFNFSESAELRKDGRYASAIVYGIDSSKVGVVSVLRPARSAYLESVHESFQEIESCLLAVLIAIVAVASARRVRTSGSLAIRMVGTTAIIWLTRYALLWIDIPSSLVGGGVFDPANFASQFGGGLAKSIGELTLTVLALVFTTALLGRDILKAMEDRDARRLPQNILVRGLLAAAVVMLTFWVLRGFGAVVRSAVFDSTLSYIDPKVILPSYELGVMVFNLLCVSCCMFTLVAGSVWFVVALLSRQDDLTGGASWLAWTTAGVLFVGAAILFDLIQETPLMSTWYRVSYAFASFVFLYVLLRSGKLTHATHRTVAPLLAFALSAVLLYPLLVSFVRDKDQQRIEAFAGEVVRPVDSWFSFIVDEALKSLESEETAAILVHGSQDELDRLAFERWARSTSCRLGYTSSFTVFDLNDEILSRWTIGGQAIRTVEMYSALRLPEARQISVREVGSGINATRVYMGTTPIADSDGVVVGYGRVIIAAGQQALFRGENPAILRERSQEGLESFYRPVMVTEFHDGTLLTSTNPSLPLHYAIPADVRSRLADPAINAFWADEVIAGRTYQTYFVKRTQAGDEIIALSLQALGFVLHFIGIMKLLLYCSAIVLAVYLISFGMEHLRGRRRVMTFRDRLLAALLLIAIVPLVLVVIYGRVYSRERGMQAMTRRLDELTSSIAVNITEPPEEGGSPPAFPISYSMAEQIAADVGSDFNLHVDKELAVSTRPELYDAEILDTRLSGSAYASVVLEGQRFHLETESIGRYQYAVGYRAVIDTAGSIIGVVSVPTLFRQDLPEEDLAKQNGFLFAVYAFALLFVIIIATTLANRIAAPIHRLTEATRLVAGGDLDVTVNFPRADGEIGELIQSFDQMTEDLKKNRENLVKIERELAWREMAKQVAHEIKNPLTPMRLAIQHLRQTYRDRVANFDQVFSDVTKTVIEQIDTLSRIASEFSHFARMPKPRMEVCTVNEVIAESVQLFEQNASIRFELHMTPDLPPLIADREELRRAFINIIRNAIQAMNNEGAIAIRTDKTEGSLRVTIRDNGPGIPEELKKRLFQPNFSTKTEGMGLGLAIVKKTVDDLGGRVSIASSVGHGTTVTILLPPTQTLPE